MTRTGPQQSRMRRFLRRAQSPPGDRLASHSSSSSQVSPLLRTSGCKPRLGICCSEPRPRDHRPFPLPGI
eukprot:6557009-Prymnesium_polylepis.1